MHPMLTGDAAAQLRTIATTPYWRALHLAMLAGSGFIIAGVWVRLVSDHSMAALLVAALALVSIGIALNALNIAFMAGSGTHMAALFSSGRAEMQSVFEATRKYPDRFSGLAGIDPTRGVAGLKELDRAVREYGFVGARELHQHGFAVVRGNS